MKKILLLGILTLVFKEITLHQDIRLVTQILKQSQQVENLVMRQGERKQIVYEGSFQGEPETLVQMLRDSLGDRLHIEVQAKTNGADGVEITFHKGSTPEN